MKLVWPPNCDRCGEPLKEPGAIVLGPPDENGSVSKYHLCPDRCWRAVLGILFEERPMGRPPD